MTAMTPDGKAIPWPVLPFVHRTVARRVVCESPRCRAHQTLSIVRHARSLRLRLPTSRFIGQSLALESLQRNFRALHVINAELGAGVHAEVEFGQVTRKMPTAHVLIDTDQAALEDRKETFQGVGVNITAYEFVLGVIDRLVLRF